MFDWLKNLLFDVEVEEIEEDKLEKIDFTKVNTIDNIVNESVQTEEKEVVREEIKEIIEEKPQIKKEFNIQLIEPEKEEKPQQETRPTRKSETKTEQKEIYIGSVISPIFGGHEEKKNEPNSKPILPKKKRDSLGTVISPMYGQAELLNHEKEAKTKIEEIKKEPIVINDDWKNDIPLEELISNEEENTDCVQFSLFGEDVE